MAKKDLRAQMDAARAAAAYIGAAQEDLAAPERGISPSGSSARSSEKDGAKAAPRRSRTHEVRSASLDVTQAAAMPDFFAEDYTEEPRCEAIPSVSYGIASVLAASDAAGTAEAADAAGMVEAADTAGMVEGAGAGTSGRMTAQVRVPMTAEQREHADLLASVMKITRAEVMRQALDEYWESHKSDLQAAVAACEALTKSS